MRLSSRFAATTTALPAAGASVARSGVRAPTTHSTRLSAPDGRRRLPGKRSARKEEKPDDGADDLARHNAGRLPTALGVLRGDRRPA